MWRKKVSLENAKSILQKFKTNGILDVSLIKLFHIVLIKLNMLSFSVKAIDRVEDYFKKSTSLKWVFYCVEYEFVEVCLTKCTFEIGK